MPTNTYTPKGPLEGLVDFFWYCNEQIDTLDCITLPITRIEMVFNYSSEYRVTGEDRQPLLDNCPAWLSGLQSRQSKTHITKHNENIGVVFTPLGLPAFTKIPLSEFSDKQVPLDEVWGNETLDLYEKMAACTNALEKFDVLERFLISKLNTFQPRPNLLHAIKAMNDPSALPRIYQLCKAIGTSRKSLNHLFTKYIGMPAGEYKRLLKFNRTLNELTALGDQRLSDIGYGLDYFDQSHFIREFSAFSGMTPGDYYSYVAKLQTSSEAPNFIACQEG